MNRINWTRKAVKQLGRLSKADQPVIYDAVQSLAWMPNAQNVKKLVNHSYGYRLRVGITGCCSTGMVESGS